MNTQQEIVVYSPIFNGKNVECIGTVVGKWGNCYIVDFEHDGVKYRGAWPIEYCK